MTRHRPRFSLALAATAALAACASAPSGSGASRALTVGANPSAVIATELAFARAAREDGQWTAFKRYATKDALWPVPHFAPVHESLKNASDPAQAIVWRPDAVWSSCDGTYAFSTGPADYPSGQKTRFATVWQRQANGAYRWVLDQGFDLEDGYVEPEMIAGRVADCPPGADRTLRRNRLAAPARGLDWSSGDSPDGTLAWATELRADCTRVMTVRVLRDGAMAEAFRAASTPQAVPEGQPRPTCAPSP